ncbi:hypothetical protein GCK32_010930 [Trichostrongylus colubriformis]|uniref:Uncharacterized protein n=1 Tax=Trichostrongylus colubriformis TaxID=6319 RepID=A0AAN8IXP1_TRICO
MQEQYMRTLEWILSEYPYDDDYNRFKALYEMVLQWLEDLVLGVKGRERVKNEMIREWKKMDDKAKKTMISRFLGFKLINDMANAK